MTQYDPLPRHRKMKWLLSDGRIAEEPSLEQSGEGRRVRVLGSTKSVYKKDLDDLIYRSVQSYARSQGVRVWMRAHEDPVRELYDNDAGMGKPKEAGNPHFLDAKSYYRRSSELSWTFRHESLPIAARLIIKMEEERGSSRKQTVSTTLHYPSTNPADAFKRTWMSVSSPNGFRFAKHSEGTTEFAQAEQLFNDFLRDNVPEWVHEILGQQQFDNEREAAGGIARLCKRMESYESIAIPDLRDPGEPGWLELGLYETTYSPEYLRALVDFINGQPIAEELASLWGQMVEAFRSAGIVVNELQESDFAAAIQGETERVDITTKTVVTEDGTTTDEKHYVGFNLMTGTITVSCKVRDTDPGDVATEYEIARIKAEARGELDAFLNHQATYLSQSHERYHRNAVEQRTIEVSDELDELLTTS